MLRRFASSAVNFIYRGRRKGIAKFTKAMV